MTPLMSALIFSLVLITVPGQAAWDCASGSSQHECSDNEPSLNLLQTKAIRKHAVPSPRLSLEPAGSLPSGFELKGPSPKNEPIRLSFFVKNQNLDILEEALMNVSDPFSSSYGKHWVNVNVQSLVAPKADHAKVVMQFLQSHGLEVTRATPNGDVLTAVTTTEHAEHILEARYEAVSHLRSGRILHRCMSGYTLPAHVASAVDFVSPTVRLMSPPPPSFKQTAQLLQQKTAATTTTTTTAAAYNNSGVCPDYNLYPTDPKALRALYSISGTVGQDPRSKQAVTGFIGQTYNLQNLRDYWTLYCHGILCGKGDPGNVGSNTEGDDQAEAMLDVDVITGVAGNIYTEFWGFTDPEDQDDPFINWLIKASRTNDDVIPKVFSTSYGEDEDAFSHMAAQRLNIEFMKMGVRGISVLFASGDAGANLHSARRPKGADPRSPNIDTFQPEGPGSSPYVTTVGATAPTRGFPQPGSETATALSSGGFSNYWAQPSYQKLAVQEYLRNAALPNLTKYRVQTKGRAYPDVSAQGYSFCVTPDYVEGVMSCAVGGTSASTPTVSGIFSLLNDLRIGLGKPPLGFLNPLIYRYPEAFSDISTGYSTVDGKCTSAPAWPATRGWDAVTGVGTPNYAKLAEIVRKLP